MATQVLQSVVSSDRANVTRFLEGNRPLTHTLLEALTQVGKFFGPKHQAFVTVIENPETSDAPDLYVEIESGLAVDLALERLDDFRVDWLFTKTAETTQGLTFGVRFA